jgi:hypothetical protein
VLGFRKIVVAHVHDGRKKWPRALKVTGDKLALDLKALDVGVLTPGQISQALDLLRRGVKALESGGEPS